MNFCLKQALLILVVMPMIALSQLNYSFPSCPGRYCGRTRLEEGLSLCGACPRGFRSDGYVCNYCSNPIKPYEIMFLLQIFLWYYLVQASTILGRSKVKALIGALVVFLDMLASCLFTVLLQNPVGKLSLDSCGMDRISDWYPYLYNPTPKHTYQLHCANEAAYPLITFILIFGALQFFMFVCVRVPLLLKLGLAGS
jgi:hypothetical protein